MNKSSPNCKNEFIEEKRKLLYWFTQWKDEDFLIENHSFDIKEMSVLLQLMGFRLEKNFEKVLNVENSLNSTDNNILKLELTCPKSGLQSVLIKETTSCKCPTEEVLNEGEFWSVSSSVRRGSINSSNSSLLPTVTPAKSVIIRGLLSKVLALINNFDSNDNEENSSMVITSLARHRSLDTLKNTEATFTSLRGIKRRPSWEVDPKTSPPTQTSSPVPNLCHSLGQVSLNCDKSMTVLRNLENIKKLVDETLDIAAGNNLTYTKNNIPTKRVSDINPIKSPTAVTPNASNKIVSTPRKVLTPKKKLLSLERDKAGVPSRIASLKKKTSTSSTAISSGTIKTPMKPTPSPNFIKRNVVKSTELKANVKSRIAVKSSGAIRNVPKENESIKKPQITKKSLE